MKNSWLYIKKGLTPQIFWHDEICC